MVAAPWGQCTARGGRDRAPGGGGGVKGVPARGRACVCVGGVGAAVESQRNHQGRAVAGGGRGGYTVAAWRSTSAESPPTHALPPSLTSRSGFPRQFRGRCARQRSRSPHPRQRRCARCAERAERRLSVRECVCVCVCAGRGGGESGCGKAGGPRRGRGPEGAAIGARLTSSLVQRRSESE